MNDSKQRKLGVILSYGSIVLSTIIQLLYTPFLVGKLGSSEYGLYSLVASIIGYLAVLDLGFGDAIVLYTAKYRAQNKKEEEKKLHGMFLVIFTVIAIVTCILGIIIYFNVSNIFGNSMTQFEIDKMKILMLILTFNLAITFPFSVYTAILKAYEKFVFQKIIAIINSLLQPIIMIPVLFMGYKSISLTITITALNVFSLLSNYIYCRKKLNIKIKYCGFDKMLFKQIFNFSIFVFMNIIVDRINWSADQAILGICAGTLAVSYYAVATKINDMFIKLSSAISGVMFPKISKMIATNRSDKEISDEFIKIGRLQYLVIFLITSGFVLFGKEFFVAWVGAEYVTSYYIAIILVVPLAIPLIQNIGISILQAKNLHKFRSILYLCIAMVNIIISIPLAKYFGGIGAAMGTSLSLIVGNIIIINIYYYKKAAIDIPKFWKEILKMTVPLAIPIVIVIVLQQFMVLSGFTYVFVYAAIYTVLYAITVYCFSINKYEKDLINKFMNKLHLRRRINASN